MTRHTLVALAGLFVAAALPALAHADPCTADVTRFQAGQAFTGTVRYIGDGDSICVGPTPDPSSWVEVRLENWFAPELHEPGGPEAKALMVAIAQGRGATCVVRRGRNGQTYSYDRVIATCSVGGRDLAAMARANGGQQGGRGYR